MEIKEVPTDIHKKRYGKDYIRRGICMVRKEKKKEEKEIVYVDINDILEFAKKTITERYGGIGYTDIEYIDDIDKLKFTIPKLDRKGKCDETEYFESEKCGKDGGCGGTGGACVCGKPKGHEGDHECEFCGADW